MASWLTYSLQLTGSREFTCEEFTEEQCSYYMQRWHFWYIADYVYALPTVAFFMSILGIFIIGNFLSSRISGSRRLRGFKSWQKAIAAVRYMSYRGYHVKALAWNSAPVGILLLGAAGSAFFFCMDLIPQPYYWPSEDYGGSPPLGTRSGWMALACMPFVFATATKTSWITLTTGVSHERIQIFHRWTAYAFFLLALMHTFPFIIYHIHWHDMVMQVTMMSTLFYWTGIVALVFQAWLTFASHSLIRHFGYELFKITHFFSALVFVVVLFWHCDYTLTSWHYFIATAAVYVPCYIYPWLRTTFEYGVTRRAHVTVLNNDFMRIEIPSINMQWRPGQHCFLRFMSFGLQPFSSHPFTICSLPAKNEKDKSELIFYIRHAQGLTHKLFECAKDHPNVAIPVLIDGPYGGIALRRFNEADRLLVISGGSGAGWALSLLELYCRQHSAGHSSTNVNNSDDQGSSCPERNNISPSPPPLHIVLATRDVASRAWFLDAASRLLNDPAVPLMSPNIIVEVFLTGEAQKAVDSGVLIQKPKDLSTLSDNVDVSSQETNAAFCDRELFGRPDLPALICQEGKVAGIEDSELGVYVCGPVAMQNDVRNAVARENATIVQGSGSRGVYLHTEHFSWA